MTCKQARAGAFIVLMAVVLSACSPSARPPHFGFFLKDESDLLEMQEFVGSPEPDVLAGIPVTNSAQPTIVVWHDRITPQWLGLLSGYGDGDSIGYDTTPTADGLLEMRPQQALAPDVYCFVQGDPLGTPSGLATWCFRVAEGASPGQALPAGTGAGAPSWLPLVGLTVLALGALGIFFGFGRVNGIQDVARVALCAGQWRVQLLKSANSRSRLTRERSLAVANLGAQAWEQRVEHPDYADTFAQLSALEEQRSQVQQELDSLNADLQRETAAQNEIQADFGSRIDTVRKKKDAAGAQLRQLQARQQDAAKRLAESGKQQQTLDNDLRSTHEKLSRAQMSSADGGAERAAMLMAAIKALERSSADLAAQTPDLQSDVAQLLEAQQPLEAEVAQHDLDLTELQAAQKAALDPVGTRLSELRAGVRASGELASAITEEMKALMVSLGGQVALARPEAPALANAFDAVDCLSKELEAVSNEGDLLKARLVAVEDAAVLRKFYLLIGAGLAVLVVAALLIFAR